MLANIMMLVKMVVGTSSVAWHPGEDLTMPDGHGVDDYSLRLCGKVYNSISGRADL